jgi:hypothetical protein
MAHSNLIAISVVVAALALVLQAVVLVGVYLVVSRFLRQVSFLVTEVRQRAVPFMEAASGIVQDSREPVRNLLTNLSDISRTLKERTNLVDAKVGEMVEIIRLQVARLDHLIATFVEKVTRTADVIQSEIFSPVYRVSAVLKGVQAGLNHFLARRRSGKPREMTQDEELFI